MAGGVRAAVQTLTGELLVREVAGEDGRTVLCDVRGRTGARGTQIAYR